MSLKARRAKKRTSKTNSGVRRPLLKWTSHSQTEAAIVGFEHQLTFDDES